MCRVGGPRCYTEASRRFVSATTEYQQAADLAERMEQDPSYLAMPGDARWSAAAAWRDPAKAARLAYEEALVELAATRTGRAEVEALLESGDPLASSYRHSVMQDADWVKERGRMVRAIRAEDGGPETVVGFTGDPETDRLITQAAERFAADPGEHKNPGPVQKVKRYATAAERTAGIRRWSNGTVNTADDYRRALRRLRSVEADIEEADSSRADELHQSLTWARDDVARSESRLVIMAQKLRIAKSREVPVEEARPAYRVVGLPASDGDGPSAYEQHIRDAMQDGVWIAQDGEFVQVDAF